MSEFALGGQKLGAGKGGKKKAHIFEFISNNIVPFCNAQPSTVFVSHYLCPIWSRVLLALIQVLASVGCSFLGSLLVRELIVQENMVRLSPCCGLAETVHNKEEV